MNGVFDDLCEVADACLLPIVQDPANRGRSYPAMRVVDLYFWYKGA